MARKPVVFYSACGDAFALGVSSRVVFVRLEVSGASHGAPFKNQFRGLGASLSSVDLGW